MLQEMHQILYYKEYLDAIDMKESCHTVKNCIHWFKINKIHLRYFEEKKKVVIKHGDRLTSE